jgi:hypothetical protein
LLDTEKFGGRKWPGEVLRLAMLMTHYREPIDFEAVEAAGGGDTNEWQVRPLYLHPILQVARQGMLISMVIRY